MARPDWWNWELVFTMHVELRMEERDLSELELRTVLQDPAAIEPATLPGRWIVTGRRGGRIWHVVLEPDFADEVSYVVTAFTRRLR